LIQKSKRPFENVYMSSNGFFISIVCFFLSVNAFAQISPTLSEDLFVICKREQMSRWIRAYKLESGKCQTQYSKEGYLQIISSATYFSSCEGVLLSVQKNLEEGGFKCNTSQKYAVIELD
jgi:hypothetical protein